MNKILLIKSFRDLFAAKRYFITIIIILAIGFAVGFGLNSAKVTLEQTLTRMEEQSNYTDLYVESTEDVSDKVSEFAKVDGVESVVVRRQLEFQLDTQPVKYMRVLEYQDVQNLPILQEGKLPTDDNSAIINLGFYSRNDDVQIHKTITLKAGNQLIPVTIDGVFVSPEFIRAPHSDFFSSDYGVIMVSSETFTMLSNYATASSTLLLQGNSINTEKIINLMGDSYITFYNTYDHYVYVEFYYYLGMILGVYANFLVVFLMLICGALTIIGFSRLITLHRKNIGTMLACGYSPNQVLLQYELVGLLITLITVSIGCVLGVFIAKIVANFYANIFNMPSSRVSFSLSSAVGISLLVMATVSGSIFIAYKRQQLREPLTLLRPSALRTHHISRIEYLRYFNTLSSVMKNMVRVIGGSLGKQVINLLITSISAVLLLLLFMFINNNLLIQIDKDFMLYDARVATSRAVLRWQLDEFMEQLGIDEYQVSSVYDTDIHKGQPNEFWAELIITDNELHAYNLEASNLANDSVSISSFVADNYGLVPGDSLSIPLNGASYTVKIDSIFRHYKPIILMDPKALGLEAMNILYNRVELLMDIDDLQLREKIATFIQETDYIAGINYMEELWQKIEDGEQLTQMILKILIGLIALLNFYVCYLLNHGNYVNNVKDIATMRRLGVSQSSARRILNLPILINLGIIAIFSYTLYPPLMNALHTIVEKGRAFADPLTVVTMSKPLLIMAISYGILMVLNIWRVKRVSLLDHAGV